MDRMLKACAAGITGAVVAIPLANTFVMWLLVAVPIATLLWFGIDKLLTPSGDE